MVTVTNVLKSPTMVETSTLIVVEKDLNTKINYIIITRLSPVCGKFRKQSCVYYADELNLKVPTLQWIPSNALVELELTLSVFQYGLKQLRMVYTHTSWTVTNISVDRGLQPRPFACPRLLVTATAGHWMKSGQCCLMFKQIHQFQVCIL